MNRGRHKKKKDNKIHPKITVYDSDLNCYVTFYIKNVNLKLNMSNRGRHKKSKQHLIIQILGIKIANRMMECQKEQGNIPNLDVFLKSPTASKHGNGFTWSDTKEGHSFWDNLIDIFKEHQLYKQYKNGRS